MSTKDAHTAYLNSKSLQFLLGASYGVNLRCVLDRLNFRRLLYEFFCLSLTHSLSHSELVLCTRPAPFSGAKLLYEHICPSLSQSQTHYFLTYFS